MIFLMSNPKTQQRICYNTKICFTIAKAQMLSKLYIQNIDVEIMNNVSTQHTGLTSLFIRQQETH
jgi:hypothetical protein